MERERIKGVTLNGQCDRNDCRPSTLSATLSSCLRRAIFRRELTGVSIQMVLCGRPFDNFDRGN